MKLRDSENFVVLGLFLGAVGLLSALVLALVSNLTKPAIEKAELKTQSEALKQLKFKPFDNTQDKCEYDGVTFIAIRNGGKGGKLVGIAAEAKTDHGYAGKIKELVGFDADTDWTITAVLVTEEKETPGLGKAVCERKIKKNITNFWKAGDKKLPPNEILDQFSGRKAGGKIDWRVEKDGGEFKFRTGATVTSRAVVEMTGKAAKTFAEHRAEILKEFGETAPEVKK